MEWIARKWLSWVNPDLKPEDKLFYDLKTSAETTTEHPDLIIIFVHGTQFFRIPKEGVAWTRPQSRLWTTLSTALQNKKAIVNRFSWSGRNSFLSRFIARNKLLELLIHTKRTWPTTPVFLIGHSHGGNIINSAALDSLNVAGIVCLATPFLCVERRKIHPIYKAAPAIIAGLLGIASFFMSVLWLASSDWVLDLVRPGLTRQATAMFLIFGFIVLAGTVLLGVLGPSIMNALVTLRIFHHAARRHIFAMARPPRLPRDKVLFIRAIGDEASFFLSLAYMAGRLLDLASNIVFSFSRIGRWIEHAVKPIARLPSPIQILVFFAFSFSFPLFLLMLGDQVAWMRPTVRACFMLVYALSGLAPALALVAVASWLLGGLVLATALGPEMLLIGPTFRVAAEGAPPGCWEIATFRRSVTYDDNAARLAHSQVYGNQNVLDHIGRWLASRL